MKTFLFSNYRADRAVVDLPESATQNLDLLLNAFDDVTQTVGISNDDVKESDKNDGDDDWEEMCDFLTQKNRVTILQSILLKTFTKI